MALEAASKPRVQSSTSCAEDAKDDSLDAKLWWLLVRLAVVSKSVNDVLLQALELLMKAT